MIYRELPDGERQQSDFTEWTCEGSLKLNYSI